jgi:Zn-dependent hydrolases, including glyoxylases
MPRVETLLQGSLLGSNQGGIAFCAVTLIEGTDSAGQPRRILVDTGSSGRVGALVDALDRRGLTPADIDAVVLTHAHWDHIQILDPFSRAIFHMHPAELDYIKNPHAGDHATPRWTKAVLDRYDVREVTGDTELMPGVSIVEAPGHSAGTIAVAVETTDGIAVVTGDSIQSAEVATHGRNALVFWNEEQANRSVTRLVELADIIHPGHDLSFRMSASGAVEYTDTVNLTITGMAAGTPGLTLLPPPPFKPNICVPMARPTS